MRIAIWHWSSKPFDGELARREATGGTEAAIVHTSEALVQQGHEVEVWCRAEQDRRIEGVQYRDARGFAHRVSEHEYDAFVVVRHLGALAVPVRCRAVAYWAHDNLDQPFVHGMYRLRSGPQSPWENHYPLGELQGHVDAVLAVSQWQARTFAEGLGIDAERIHVIQNGLPPGRFDPDAELTGRPPVILYSLPPDRGLAELLEIFADVRREVPEAELHAYSRRTIYGVPREEDDRLFGPLYELAGRMPGVRHFDPVDPVTLAERMQGARLFAYPTETEETYCISVLEAQAAGLVPVTSACGALPERIDDGVDGHLIHGSSQARSFRMRFARRLVQCLQDEAGTLRQAEAARRRAHDPRSSYGAVARRLEQALAPLMRQPLLERAFEPFAVGSSHGVPGALPSGRSREELARCRRQFEQLLALRAGDGVSR